MKILGLTGPGGAGKTTAVRYLEEKGFRAVVADEVYHNLLRTDADMLREIRQFFPDTFNGDELNRKALGSLVFYDENAMEALEKITHPVVTEKIKSIIAGFEAQGAELAVVEAIALCESGASALCDAVAAIAAGPHITLNRVTARDDVSVRYAAARLHSQQSPAYYREHADYVIENEGSLSDLYAQIDRILEDLL